MKKNNYSSLHLSLEQQVQTHKSKKSQLMGLISTSPLLTLTNTLTWQQVRLAGRRMLPLTLVPTTSVVAQPRAVCSSRRARSTLSNNHLLYLIYLFKQIINYEAASARVPPHLFIS